MLAYVFWHWPAVSDGYEAALLSFHRALAASPPAGFHGSMTARVEGRPWIPVHHAFEDWYFISDFTALGVLNEAAVSAARKGPHDVIAALPAGGAAGLYAHRRGHVAKPRHAVFEFKTAGESYDAYWARSPADTEVWQRQMVFGPAPELCVMSHEARPASYSMDVLYCAR